MRTTTQPKTTSPTDGFKSGHWQKEINVQDFIQQNYWLGVAVKLMIAPLEQF